MCMCLVCVLDKLIILYKFVNEKEKQKKKKTEKTTTEKTKQKLHLHYSNIIVFVVLLM